MRARFADHFLPVLRMQADRDLIAHGAGGDKDCSFALENFRGALLQPVDRRVFAIDIVADFRGGHGGTHRRSWLGHGVAAQINGAD